LLPSRGIHQPSIAAPSLFRSAGQHPPLAPFGHLSSGQIGIAAERIETTTATTETGAPARAATTATAGTTWATAATAARTTRTARTARTSPSTAAAIPIAATPIITARVSVAPTFRPRHHVRHIVEIALLLGVGRRLVTRQDAHQAHPGCALAHNRERFHQT
jgi:hypothetical protein